MKVGICAVGSALVAGHGWLARAGVPLEYRDHVAASLLLWGNELAAVFQVETQLHRSPPAQAQAPAGAVAFEPIGTTLGFDEERVEQAVARLLRNSHLTVATAESCTAGAVMTRLATIPGASAYLRGGLVAYATEVKSSVLGLDKGLVDEHGPVSLPTTEAMARRAQELFDADLGLGVTCVAGPEPQGGRRVGTIVWALAARDGEDASGELEIIGDRPSVQMRAAMVVLEALRRHLSRTSPTGGGGHRGAP